MAKERSPLDMIHEKIKRRIDQLPEKALQRKITINGRGGKGQHTLAELKRMPRLIPFITERDLWDQFPGVLKKRTEKRHPVTPFS